MDMKVKEVRMEPMIWLRTPWEFLIVLKGVWWFYIIKKFAYGDGFHFFSVSMSNLEIGVYERESACRSMSLFNSLFGLRLVHNTLKLTTRNFLYNSKLDKHDKSLSPNLHALLHISFLTFNLLTYLNILMFHYFFF